MDVCNRCMFSNINYSGTYHLTLKFLKIDFFLIGMIWITSSKIQLFFCPVREITWADGLVKGFLWCMKGWTWFTRNNPAVINIIIWKIAWQYLQFRSTDVILTALNMHSWVKEGNLIYLNLYWIHIRKILN